MLKQVTIFALMLSVVLTACGSSSSELPIVPSATTTSMPTQVQATEIATRLPQVTSYTCFGPIYWEYIYTDNIGTSHDFLLEPKMVDGVQLPWVVTANEINVQYATLAEGEEPSFCVPDEFLPIPYGRGPHQVSKIIFYTN